METLFQLPHRLTFFTLFPPFPKLFLANLKTLHYAFSFKFSSSFSLWEGHSLSGSKLSCLCCHGHSIFVLYRCRINRKKSSSCCGCDRPLPDVIHLFLLCPSWSRFEELFWLYLHSFRPVVQTFERDLIVESLQSISALLLLGRSRNLLAALKINNSILWD